MVMANFASKSKTPVVGSILEFCLEFFMLLSKPAERN